MKAKELDQYTACAIAEGFCEGEGATAEERLEAWAHIARSGLWKIMQGFYGRTVHTLVDQGYIDFEGNYYPELLNTEQP